MSEFYVVCFDVGDARRLRKVSDTLENYGVRVQRSVFECHLDAVQLAALQDDIAALIDVGADRVRYYPLCMKDRPAILIDGVGAVSADPDYRAF